MPSASPTEEAVDASIGCTGRPTSSPYDANPAVPSARALSATGAIQYHLLSSIDGLKAVTILGKKYVVQDVFNHEFVFSGADEDTFDMTAHYVRLGEDGTFVLGDDFYEYMKSHITTNAQGMITSFYVRMSDSPCQ